MKIYIRNMVCARCKMVVSGVLTELGYKPVVVELGEVEISGDVDSEGKDKINNRLKQFGFELIDDKRSKIIDRVKTLVVDIVHNKDGDLTTNLSDLLSNELHHEYNYISNLFSSVEGTTIEKYFIAQKIERVKELIIYDELSLSEISFRMHYSSVAHLSSQFKKVTGLTPSEFKAINGPRRTNIDEV
ncbi:MAG TPA: AraC family transcriptional regulator [Chitinophagales bacterium]|nr:AraC family transcriptional regulator [Chitinophagales bacterium]HMX03357.1 AraC family transcriptional regulator [Chitinophagales bacterium]HNF68640.1 AraC family transcriptional regulator [Chitinophagales bacterium]HNO28594.1 AraC family transcriptional regulator [Chitinophagales bacterium]